MLATRPLFTGTFPEIVPPGVVTALTSSPHGGWSNPTYPKAMYASGKTYIGYVNGGTGGLYVAEREHATGTVTLELLDTPDPIDDHNNPAVLVLASGKVLVAFSEHDGASVFTAITSSGDITTMGSPSNMGITSSSGFTYPGLAQLTGVSGDPVYHFIRDKSASLTGRIRMLKSTDEGATWGSSSIVFAPGASKLPYWALAHDATKIHIMTTDDDPYAGTTSVGHFYFDGTTETWHQSDGTSMGSPPFDLSDITTVYSGAAFPLDGMVVGGNPRFTLLRDIGGGDVTGTLYRWNGSAWVDSDVYTNEAVSFDRYYGGLAINHANPSEMFSFLEGAGMRRFVSSDGGATWGAAIEVDDDTTDASPIGIVDGVSSLPAVWLRGSFTSQSVFAWRVMGLVR